MESSVLLDQPESRPTGVDIDLAYFFAEEAKDSPALMKELKECGCAICKMALRELNGWGL